MDTWQCILCKLAKQDTKIKYALYSTLNELKVNCDSKTCFYQWHAVNELLHDDLFFLLKKEHQSFGTKKRNCRLIPSEDFFFLREQYPFLTKNEKSGTDSKQRLFFLKNTINFGQKLVFVLESQTIFLSYL